MTKEEALKILDTIPTIGEQIDALEMAIEALENSSSAQPEVIRCKDCKHREVENGFCEGRGWPMQLVPDDGFCDKGERKDNG